MLTLKEYHSMTHEERQALSVDQIEQMKKLDKENYLKHLKETGRIKTQNNR